MKFFKHFTDAHRGQSLKVLQRRLGFGAIGRYWTLVEMCAEKMEKDKDEEFTIQHCRAEFETSHLMTSLGFANRKQTSSYLQAIAELGLCEVQETPEVTSCSMPKLLECLDRDAKRARPERGQRAPKKKNKEEDKDISDVEKENQRLKFNLSELVDLYPRQEKKFEILKILAIKIQNDADREAWRKAIQNYLDHLVAENQEIKYAQSFENFAKDFEHWRDFNPRKLKPVRFAVKD